MQVSRGMSQDRWRRRQGTTVLRLACRLRRRTWPVRPQQDLPRPRRVCGGARNRRLGSSAGRRSQDRLPLATRVRAGASHVGIARLFAVSTECVPVHVASQAVGLSGGV